MCADNLGHHQVAHLKSRCWSQFVQFPYTTAAAFIPPSLAMCLAVVQRGCGVVRFLIFIAASPSRRLSVSHSRQMVWISDSVLHELCILALD